VAQTLEYRLEQNQAEQRRLSNITEQKIDREVYRAIRWISKKEPELADALVESQNHEVVFKELCRVYRREFWTSKSNTRVIWLRYSLTAYLFRYMDVFVNKPEVTSQIVILTIIFVIQTLIKGVLLTYFVFPTGKIGFPLVALYPISIVVRIFLRVMFLHYNLTWDAPICRWYSFQKKYSKQIQVLKEREKYLRTSLNLIEKVKIRRFENDSAWFYKALEGRSK
jgi:hypothetical protein